MTKSSTPMILSTQQGYEINPRLNLKVHQNLLTPPVSVDGQLYCESTVVVGADIKF